MILVDTSALVGLLSGRHSEASLLLRQLLLQDAPIVLTSIVVQEVLQGARDEGEWRRLRRYLDGQPRVEAQDPYGSGVEAARIYFDCRRRALTVRSSVDCLVAQIALEHDLALLHDDRDFDAIARVRPLRTLP